MKKLAVLVFFIGSVTFGQNFFEHEDSESEESTTQNSAFQSQPEYEEPDQGVDSIGNPGDEVPIDKWIFLLPLAGIALGFYFLEKKRSKTV